MYKFTRLSGLFLLVVILMLAVFQIPIKSQTADEVVKDEAERISEDEFTVTTKTPKGVKIKAVKKPSKKLLKAIDKGFADLFAIAKKSEHNYKKMLKYSDYTVFIAKADRTKNVNGDYSPDIAVNAAQYKNTKFDKGGYIYAAGMVIGFKPNAFLIADHKQDFDRVSNVVRYEGEHIVLYHNDRKLFNETADHSKGGGHPILQ